MLQSVRVALLFYAASALLVVGFGVLKLLQCFHCMERPLMRLFLFIATVEIRKDAYWANVFGWESLKAHLEMIQLELQREAVPGKIAPNPPLVSLDGKEKSHLLDHVRGSRPLIVNLGSCTCPVFMKRQSEFKKIVEEFMSVADFATVYIKEAHPSDEWKFEGNIEIQQPRTIQERCRAAQKLKELNKLHPSSRLLVDTMENLANKSFAGLPTRLYIIHDGRVQYAGGMGPTFYHTQDIMQWLAEYKKKSTRQRAKA
ncbi:predicted protein [Nematostella vectensis]|uniref:Iodothyronine deiodinase n=1 Tax=Nematostella vectensis TaxID=45351 RepID=A7RVT4_NEMVE|nr:type I iodothyronine deiodinase [Nematostella vectensis]EDO44508.1 predicted protein [Nematostella vectensis]|eukprot:XP_001636571.1 predicted protein [Nematostella vectensis]